MLPRHRACRTIEKEIRTDSALDKLSAASGDSGFRNSPGGTVPGTWLRHRGDEAAHVRFDGRGKLALRKPHPHVQQSVRAGTREVGRIVSGRSSAEPETLEAYFAEGRNLAEPLVLLEVAEAVGLERDAAEEMIRKRSFRDAVDADWKRAHELGVTGVPTFVSGNRGLVGAQPYETLEQLIRTSA